MLRIREGYRNGKVPVKWLRKVGKGRSAWVVSIPFKRESGDKGGIVVEHRGRDVKVRFQFPSNGKPYPKNSVGAVVKTMLVEFQFPSYGKEYPKSNDKLYAGGGVEFQFPSNGNADPKLFLEEIMITVDKKTFQFPSNGKADPKE